MSQAKEFLLNTSTKVTRKISNKLLATPPYNRIRKVCKFKKELLTPSKSCELYEAPEALFNHTAIFIKLFPVKTLLVSRIRHGRKRQGPSSRETCMVHHAYLPYISEKATLLLGAIALL